MKIALCVIAKDDSEAKNLRRLLKSARKGLDAVFVTTSVVDTPKLKALKYDAPVHFSYREWTKDFAAQRNFNWEQVPSDIDYIWWADCDDEIENAAGIREIAEDMEKNGITWAVLPYIYARSEEGLGIADHNKTRVLRNDGKSRWHKAVHENLEYDGFYTYECYDGVKVLHHLAESNSYQKQSRNYEILLDEYERDGEQTDLRTVHYIGRASQGLAGAKETTPEQKKQLLEQAIFFYRWHFEKAGWDDECYESLLNTVICLILLDRYEEAKSAALQATKLEPSRPDAFWYLAKIEYTLDNPRKAMEWGEIAYRKPRPTTILNKNPQLYDLDGPVVLARSYILSGYPEDALRVAQAIAVQSDEVSELVDTARQAVELEDYVTSTVKLLAYTTKYDRKSLSDLAYHLPRKLLSDQRLTPLVVDAKEPITWPDKSIAIFCGRTTEVWADPSVIKGIGGSEEAVIYLSRELVKLGWKVVVYNSCGDLEGTYKGVEYRNYWHFNPKDRFYRLILWRCPAMALQVPNARKLWIWNHDAVTDSAYNQAIIQRADRVLFLSRWAREQVPSVPEDKVFITNNGIVPEQFSNLPAKKPYTAIYASSYDRGLYTLLKDIAPKIYEAIPEFRLHICYGWDGWLRVHGKNPEQLEWKAEVDELLAQPFVIHHGKVGHKELAQLFGESVLWIYPTEFGETNCITAQKAQAANCYALTTSESGGLPERVIFGAVMESNGIYSDSKLQKKFAQLAIEKLKGFSERKNTWPQEQGASSLIDDFSFASTATNWDKELL